MKADRLNEITSKENNESTLRHQNLTNRNRIKKTEPEIAEQPQKVKATRKRFKKITLVNHKVSFSKSVASVLDGSFLTRDNLLRQIPFIIFITFLGIFYIANSYNAEKTIIEISRTKKDLEELRYEYITTKSSLMFQSKQSEVAYKLMSSQVKESLVPPVKLVIKKDKE
ncbi:MAG TPA: FtsL-like putative cell division protein [Lentimicrobium sp.]|nr:FtsL-like putative cell division protein [Lentimicrobium sp.]